MNFFQQLHGLIADTKKVTIIAQAVGDQITVGFLPEFKSDDINEKTKMCSITGTPAEMDEGFFNEIRKPVEAATTGLKSNADEVAAEIKEAANEEDSDEKVEKERAEKKAATKKTPPAKNEAQKKAEALVKKNAPKKAADKKGIEVKVETEKEVEIEIEVTTDTAPIETETPPYQQEIIETLMDDTTIETKTEETIQPSTPLVSEFEAEDQEQLNFEKLMAEGDTHMKEKNYQAAQTAYLQAVELANASGNQSNIGKAYKAEQNAGRWVRAIERMKN